MIYRNEALSDSSTATGLKAAASTRQLDHRSKDRLTHDWCAFCRTLAGVAIVLVLSLFGLVSDAEAQTGATLQCPPGSKLGYDAVGTPASSGVAGGIGHFCQGDYYSWFDNGLTPGGALRDFNFFLPGALGNGPLCTGIKSVDATGLYETPTRDADPKSPFPILAFKLVSNQTFSNVCNQGGTSTFKMFKLSTGGLTGGACVKPETLKIDRAPSTTAYCRDYSLPAKYKPQPPLYPTPRPHSPSPCAEERQPAQGGSKAISLSTLTEQQSTRCIKVGAAGMPIVISMRYRAGVVSSLPGALGSRFRLSYSRTLEGFAKGTVGLSSITQGLRLVDENGDISEYLQNSDGSYTPVDSVNQSTLALDATTAQFVLTYPNGELDRYDQKGYLVQVQQRDGNKLIFTRSFDTTTGTVPQQLTIANPLTNEAVVMTYINGLVIMIQEQLPSVPATQWRSANLEYDANFNLAKYVDLAGRTYTYTYDSFGRLLTFADPYEFLSGTNTKLTYADSTGASDVVSTETLADGTVFTFTPVAGQPWDLQVTQAKNGQSRIYRYSRNSSKQITRIYNPNSATAYKQFNYQADGQLQSVVDQAGRVTSYSYSAPGFVSQISVANGSGNDVTTFARNSFGQVTTKTEPAGAATDYAYYSGGWLKCITKRSSDPVATQQTCINYGGVNIDQNGNGVTNTNFNTGLPTSVILPDNTLNIMTYDRRGYPASMTADANGLKLTSLAQYDPHGFLMSTTDPRGVVTSYEYANSITAGQFGNLGIPSAVVFDTAGRKRRTEITYDAALNVTKRIVDVGGVNATTRYEYQPLLASYAMTKSVDPTGRTQTYTYNPLGETASAADVGAAPSGADRVTNFNYTPEGWLYQVIRSGESTAYETRNYSSQGDGLVNSVVDGRGVTTSFSYDAKARLAALTRGTAAVNDGSAQAAVSSATSFTYDANDRAIKATQQSNGSTVTLFQRSYDGLNRLISETDGSGNITTYDSYDALNRLLQLTIAKNDPQQAGQVTQYSYDTLGRLLTEIVDPVNRKLLTKYAYQEFEINPLLPDNVNLRQKTDPKGNVIKYTYDSLGVVANVLEPTTGLTEYSYNNIGAMTSIVPATGEPTNYVTDVLGRATFLKRGDITESWVYRTDGLLASKQDAVGRTYSYAYDAQGRVIQRSVDADPAYDVTYAYKANDLLASATSKPDGVNPETVSFSYDAANRANARSVFVNGVTRTVSLGYDQSDFVNSIGYWGTTSDRMVSIAPDAGLRTASINPFAAGATTYLYRATNQLTRIDRPGTSKLMTSYGYGYNDPVTGNGGTDQSARLYSIGHFQNSNGFEIQSYTYDANSNIIKLVDSTKLQNLSSFSTFTTNYTYDNLDRLTQASYPTYPNQPASIISSIYDDAGNMARKTGAVTALPTGSAPTFPDPWVLVGAGNVDTTTTPADLIWLNTRDNSAAYWALNSSASGPQATGTRAVMAGTAGLDHSFALIGSFDMDGDGIADLVWLNSQTGEVLIGFVQNGGVVSKIFVKRPDGSLSQTPSQWKLIAAADFNGDGKGDLLWRNSQTNEVAIWIMNTTRSTSTYSVGYAVTGATDAKLNVWQLVGAGDFNGDSKADLVWRKIADSGNAAYDATYPTGTLAFWSLQFNSADATLASGWTLPANYAIGKEWTLLGAANIVPGGNSELIWRQTKTGEIAVWQITNPPSLTVTGWIVGGITYADRGVDLAFDRQDRIVGAGYQYDKNGNVISSPDGVGGAMSYTYDKLNRLRQTTKQGIVNNYLYDAFGNLIRIKQYPQSGSTVTGVYGQTVSATAASPYTTDLILNMDALPKVLGEIRSDGTETLYVYGPNGVHAKKDIAPSIASVNGQVTYAMGDYLGTVRHWAKASDGSLVASRAYDAWGSEILNTSASGYGRSDGPGWTGEWRLPDGLVYLRARTYDPKSARFLQRDSFAGFLSDPQSLNRYAYTEGSPVMRTDPSGHFSDPTGWLHFGAGTARTMLDSPWLGVGLQTDLINGIHNAGLDSALDAMGVKQCDESFGWGRQFGMLPKGIAGLIVGGIAAGAEGGFASVRGGGAKGLGQEMPAAEQLLRRLGPVRSDVPLSRTPTRDQFPLQYGGNFNRFPKANGGEEWAADSAVTGGDVKGLMRHIGPEQRIDVFSATHATKAGEMVDAQHYTPRDFTTPSGKPFQLKTDGDLFRYEDAQTMRNLNNSEGFNIRVHDMKTDAGRARLEPSGQSSNVTVRAWCFSNRCSLF